MEENLQVEEKKPRKKQDDIFTVYLAGMLTGFMLLVTIVFAVNIVKLFKEPSQPVNNNDKPIADEINFDSIVEKEELLLKLLDLYYYYDMDMKELEEALCDGILKATDDKYAAYYTAEEYAEISEKNSGEYCGIGVTVQQDAETKEIIVIQARENSPGEKAGILPGDIIKKVDGTDVSKYDLSSVVALIKGEKNSEVVVTVLRDGKLVDLTMKRDVIEVDTVSYEMIEDVLYIYIESFEDNTPEQFEKALKFGTDNNAKGIIFDLRDNPGGSLTSVEGMLDMLIKDGLLVYVQDRRGNRVDYKADDDKYVNLPMVCLVSSYSASGAELFSGTLKDYDMATIVGNTTFGKGVVQTLRQLSDGSAVKFTTAKYFTGGGTNIDGVGVIPDLKVDLNEDAIVDGVVIREKDNQFKMAWEAMRNKIDK